MSTRGAYGFKNAGKYYVTYNHSDSYVQGLGAEVIRFCQIVSHKDAWQEVSGNVEKIQLVDRNSVPTPELIERYKPFADVGVSNQTLEDWYCLLRGVQFGGFLWGVAAGELEHMIDGFDFLKDSLFCEYAYIINLDDMTLDFYRGFNKEPVENGLPFPMVPDGSGYYPVKLRASFSLWQLPLNWLNEQVMEDRDEDIE